jgi:hypothetical protein
MQLTRKPAQTCNGRLNRELVALFGRDRVAQSELMSLQAMSLEAELVAEGARQLKEHMGQVEAQRLIVQGMDDDTALALCKWIGRVGAAQ